MFTVKYGSIHFASIPFSSILKALCISLLSFMLFACAQVPTGLERVALVDKLVSQQEFKKIQNLLEDIDVSDPEFESLVIRRRAVRPLIEQYETFVIAEVELLQTKDQWPAALNLLEEAQRKLPKSKKLELAKDAFYVSREQRIQSIQQQIDILEGKNQANKNPLMEQIVAINPTGIGNRWQHYQHQRKNKALGKDLFDCGTKALALEQLDLAEACFSMVKVMAVGIDVDPQLAEMKTIREQQVIAAQQLVLEKQIAKQQQQDKKVWDLKEQYRHLAAAGWLAAAKQTLGQLRMLKPEDQEIRQWAGVLQQKIDHQIAVGIRDGQALYSLGKLEEALVTWQEAAHLDPSHAVLKDHIARVERFLQKLERLNNPKT